MVSQSALGPFLLGLSSGLLAAFLSWVVVEVLKTWRGRTRILNFSDPFPRANVRGARVHHMRPRL